MRKQIRECGDMKNKIIFAIVAIVGLYSVNSATSIAAPLRCSDEQKACVSVCSNIPDRSFIPNCIANCGARQSACKQTGCWDSGTKRYCGLTRQ
jgi:hypothetical protein